MNSKPWYKVFSRDSQQDPQAEVIKGLSDRLSAVAEAAEEQMHNEIVTKFYDVEPSNFSGGQFELAGLEQTINPATLLRLYASEPWVYSAVMAIAETIAGLPWKLKQKKIVKKQVVDEYGNIETVERETWVEVSGTLYDLFQYPNKHTSRSEFIQYILIDLIVTGDAYVYLDSDEDLRILDDARSDDKPDSPFGRLRTLLAKDTIIKEMFRIPAQLMQPVPKADGEGMGLHGYAMTSEAGVFGFLPAEIVHFKFPNPMSYWTGLSPLMAAILPILIDRYSTEHMVRFYKSGARLGGMIETSKNLTKEQITRMQRSFENDYTGRQNFYRTLVLPNGMTYKPIEQSPIEQSIIELMKSNREAILSVLRVPPIKVGVMDHANYANANAQLKIFFDDTIRPRCKMIEDSFNMKPALMPDNRSFKIEFDFSDVAVLQENFKEKAEAAKVMIESGLTVNEVRRMAWKASPIDGGDKSKAVEDIKNPTNPIFGQLSAPKGETKDTKDESPYDALAKMDRTVVTSIMNIVGRVTAGKIAPEAGAAMIEAFGLEAPFAFKLVGLEYVAPVAKTVEATPPANQPELGSDIKPTTATFEERVAQLTAVFMSRDKLSLEAAIARAVEQAKAEGLGPTDPTDPDGGSTPPTSTDGDEKAPSVEEYLAEKLASLDPDAELTQEQIDGFIKEFEEKFGPISEEIRGGLNVTASKPDAERSYAFGMSKDQVVTGWKGFIDKTEPMIKAREAALHGWFKKLSSAVKNELGANVKSYGLHKARDNDDTSEILDPANFEKLVAEYIADVDKSLKDAFKYGYTDTLVKFNFDPNNEAAKKALQQYAASRVKGILDTTREQLAEVLNQGFEEGVAVTEMSQRIDEKFAQIDSGRAATIARTETLTAVSLGRQEKREDFKKEFPDTKLMKMWVSAQDEKVRDSHQELDGTVVEVDAEFKSGLAFPRDPNCTDPSEVINCRCTDITMAAEDQTAVEATLPKVDNDDEE